MTAKAKVDRRLPRGVYALYLAALLMCVVLAFYQFRTAIVLGTNALVQFLLIGAIFVYLIQTGVRNAFLRAGDQPEPRAEDGG